MRAIETVATVEIPDGVEGTLDGRVVTIRGEKGALTRDFSHAPVTIRLEGKTVTVQASWPRKKEAALVGTVRSHIKNMIKGVDKGFEYRMKIVFIHFPMTVRIEKNLPKLRLSLLRKKMVSTMNRIESPSGCHQ